MDFFHSILLPHVIRCNFQATFDCYRDIAISRGVKDSEGFARGRARLELMVDIAIHSKSLQHISEVGVSRIAFPRLEKANMACPIT